MTRALTNSAAMRSEALRGVYLPEALPAVSAAGPFLSIPPRPLGGMSRRAAPPTLESQRPPRPVSVGTTLRFCAPSSHPAAGNPARVKAPPALGAGRDQFEARR